MSIAIESGIGGLWYAKQASKGTKATAATTKTAAAPNVDRPKLFDGGLDPKKIIGSEEYVDGQRFASPAAFTDTIGGAVGTVTIQSQAENTGVYLGNMLGVDTVTGSVDPWTHTITSAGTSASWGTWWLKTGAAVGPQREAFWDSKPGKMVWNASDQQNPVHLAIDVLALKAGEIFSADPSQAEAQTDPYYFTETSGLLTFDGKVLGEIKEHILEIDTQMEPIWGNGIEPALLVEKKGLITQSFATVATDETVKEYNKLIYGEESPAAGKLPVKALTTIASKAVYEKSATRKVTIESPNIPIKTDDLSIAPLREGGPIPLTFTGMCRKSGAEAALKVIVLSADSGEYV